MSGAAPREHARVRAIRGQRGAALIVGLVLLAALTLLASTAMTTATIELVIADNARFHRQAFEAAEAGIAFALTDAEPSRRTAAGALARQPFSAVLRDGGTLEAAVTFQAVTPVPDAAFSMGANAGTFEARHFEIIAVGRGPRGATARHRQGFYIVAPAL